METRSRKPQSQVASGSPPAPAQYELSSAAGIGGGEQFRAPVPHGHAPVVRGVADEPVRVDEHPPVAGPSQHVGRCRVTVHDHAAVRVERRGTAFGAPERLRRRRPPAARAAGAAPRVPTNPARSAALSVGRDRRAGPPRRAAAGRRSRRSWPSGGRPDRASEPPSGSSRAALRSRSAASRRHIPAAGGGAQRPYLPVEVDDRHGDLDHRRLAGRRDRGRDVRGRAAGQPLADRDPPPTLQRGDGRRQVRPASGRRPWRRPGRSRDAGAGRPGSGADLERPVRQPFPAVGLQRVPGRRIELGARSHRPARRRACTAPTTRRRSRARRDGHRRAASDAAQPGRPRTARPGAPRGCRRSRTRPRRRVELPHRGPERAERAARRPRSPRRTPRPPRPAGSPGPSRPARPPGRS